MQVKNIFKHWTHQVFAPETAMRTKYEAFRALLAHDQCAHEKMAELEAIYHEGRAVDLHRIMVLYEQFSRCMEGIVDALDTMRPARYGDLKEYYKKFDSYVREILAPPAADISPPYLLPLDDAQTLAYGELTGGKARRLAQVVRELHMPVPRGFVITTRAFNYFLEFNGLRDSIRQGLAQLDIFDTTALETVSEELQTQIREAQLPPEVEQALKVADGESAEVETTRRRYAVRSSARGEDERLTFAGQYRSVLNVPPGELATAYKAVLASKYAPRALFYRIRHGILDEETPMAVLVLEMVDAVASGVMYTRDPADPDSGQVGIHALWGLGELLVGGEGRADSFSVAPGGQGPIISQIQTKSRRMSTDIQGGTVVTEVDREARDIPALQEAEIRRLARWGQRLETHFGGAQDVEWCCDGEGRCFVLQSRPLAMGSMAGEDDACRFVRTDEAYLIRGGEAAASGAGAGPVKWVHRAMDLAAVPEGAVLVAQSAAPAYVPVLNRVQAVVTGTGSAAGHFASVAREFGVPTLVNVGVDVGRLVDGELVTVHPGGRAVYRGRIEELVEGVCAQGPKIGETPLTRRLKGALAFIAQLALVDPQGPNFNPEGCRSLHDILRFAHEKAIHAMFATGKRRLVRKQGARKLAADLPLQIYIMDVGGGIDGAAGDRQSVALATIRSRPFLALWQGLTHPSLDWSGQSHFDWAAYDQTVMNGGIISADSALFASYAVISRNYLNFALKFGYHFVIVDSFQGRRPEENYIMFRFAGGGADLEGRTLRTAFLKGILERLGFQVNRQGDLIDARLDTVDDAVLDDQLAWLGRLLGATRLMDMHLKDDAQVIDYIEDFFQGRLAYTPGGE